MKNALNSFVINYFLNSNQYEFRDFDMNLIIHELEPLLISTMDNYLYLKKLNPNNELMKNVNFIEPKNFDNLTMF